MHETNIDVLVYVSWILAGMQVFKEETEEIKDMKIELKVAKGLLKLLEGTTHTLARDVCKCTLRLWSNLAARKWEDATGILSMILLSKQALDHIFKDNDLELLKILMIMIFNWLKNDKNKRNELWIEKEFTMIFIQIFETVDKLNQQKSEMDAIHEVNEWFTRLFVFLIDPVENNSIIQNIESCVYQEDCDEILESNIKIHEEQIKIKDDLELKLLLISDVLNKIMHYSCILTNPKEELKLTINTTLRSILCSLFDKIVKTYKDTYLKEDIEIWVLKTNYFWVDE